MHYRTKKGYRHKKVGSARVTAVFFEAVHGVERIWGSHGFRVRVEIKQRAVLL